MTGRAQDGSRSEPVLASIQRAYAGRADDLETARTVADSIAALLRDAGEPGLPERRPPGAASRYPRLVAHRGWSTALPENSLAAIAAAIAVGAAEIECDARMSADGTPVVIHDPDLDRTTTGRGMIEALPLDEIRSASLKDRDGRVWPGFHVPALREVLDLCRGRIGLNLHVKSGPGLREIIALFRDYAGAHGHSPDWYVAGERNVVEVAAEIAPGVQRCLGSPDEPERHVAQALDLGCGRVQFGRNVEPADFRRCRERGLIVNYFYSNDPDEAAALIEAGVDAPLTDDIGPMQEQLAPLLFTCTKSPSALR